MGLITINVNFWTQDSIYHYLFEVQILTSDILHVRTTCCFLRHFLKPFNWTKHFSWYSRRKLIEDKCIMYVVKQNASYTIISGINTLSFSWKGLSCLKMKIEKLHWLLQRALQTVSNNTSVISSCLIVSHSFLSSVEVNMTAQLFLLPGQKAYENLYPYVTIFYPVLVHLLI